MSRTMYFVMAGTLFGAGIDAVISNNAILATWYMVISIIGIVSVYVN